QRLATDNLGDCIQPLVRRPHCREQACADRIGLYHRANARKDARIVQPSQRGNGRRFVDPSRTAELGKPPPAQREIPLPAVDDRNFSSVRCHWPILVARAAKKIPDGFAASISAFLTKLALS